MMEDPIRQLLKDNLLFHAILLTEINKTPYGQITINAKLVNGIVQIDSLNIVKSRRKKYKPPQNRP
jgi:hypothetical protein